MDINSIHTDFEEESGAAPYIHTHTEGYKGATDSYGNEYC